MEQQNNQNRPRLWNPNAAANWSFLFTPAFGSFIQMQNWKALGQSGRAASAKGWFIVSLLVLAALLAARFFLKDEKAVDGAANGLSILFLLVWYFASAKGQTKYVKEAFGTGYAKKSWGRPVVVGLAGLVGYAALSMAPQFIGGGTPDCGAEATMATLKGVVTDQVTAALPENLRGKIDLASRIEVKSIQTVARDEKLDNYTCKAELAYRLPKDKQEQAAQSIVAAFEHHDTYLAAMNAAYPGAGMQLLMTASGAVGAVMASNPAGANQNMTAAVAASLNPMIAQEIVFKVAKLEGKAEKGMFEVAIQNLDPKSLVGVAAVEAIAATPFTGPAAPVQAQAAAQTETAESKPAAVADRPAVQGSDTPPLDPAQLPESAKDSQPEKSAPAISRVSGGLVQASFDCSKAGTKTEKLICSTPETASADKRLAEAYASARAKTADVDKLKRDQIEWMKQKRDVCADASCLSAAIEERISVLKR